LGRFRSFFSKAQEKESTSYLLFIQSRLYGLTAIEMRSLAFELAEKNKIKHRFNRRKKRAGPDWLQGFVKRGRLLSLRKPQAASADHAHRFTREAVDEFFELYLEIFDEYNLSADRVWNVDEVGMMTVPKSLPKILARKGQ
ncbi:uncharacterized protein LOC107047042, partial [Diachasma alloeum]|uniref:uncharacterized protein LOC107047042 n=1 Tax=Diachasma alloeum TaxID=454923 RepID=UPI0007384157